MARDSSPSKRARSRERKSKEVIPTTGSTASKVNEAINAEPTIPKDSVPEEEIKDATETEGDEGFETAGEQQPIDPDEDPYAGLPDLVQKNKSSPKTTAQVKSSTSPFQLPQYTQSLHVHKPVSRFANLNVFAHVPDEFTDLFDKSDDSDEDTKRTLEELLKKNKKRRRRILRAVKRFNGSLTKERDSNASKTSRTSQIVHFVFPTTPIYPFSTCP